MNVKLIACVVLSLMIALPGVSAFTYEVTYYLEGTSGTSTITNPVPFFAENYDTATMTLNMRSSFNTSSNYNYTGSYFSPYSTTIAITTNTLTQNISCLNMGSIQKNYTSGIIEYRNTVTNDADGSILYTQANFVIESTDRYLRLFSYPTINDTEEIVPNIYRIVTVALTEPPTPAELAAAMTTADFSDCGDTGTFTRMQDNYSLSTEAETAYVVFNSTTGNIQYNLTIGAPAPVSRAVYYPLDNPGGVVDLGLGTSWNGSLTLDSDRLYVFATGTDKQSGARLAPTFNITIDIGSANYVCPTFGLCIDGFRTRTCIDSNGLQPDLIEIEACDFVVLENATLGFEEFDTHTDILKCNPTWFLGCGYAIANVSVDRPQNWTVVDPSFGKQNFVSMTQDWSTEGSRSVKLWYIPSKTGEPIDATTCGNLTEGRIPQLFQNVSNNTFSVNFNVTFPSENMLLSFDTKRCNDQVLQHSALIDEGFFFNVTLCEKRCYSQSCDTEPDGRYIFNLQDLTNGTSVFGSPFYSTSGTATETLSFDLTGLGVVPGISYNIVFAVSPENLNDRNGNCVMFDNVRYEVLANPFTDLVPDCLSRCVGDDFYEARLLPSGSCQVIRRDFSSVCLEPDIAEIVNVRGSFCDDNNDFNFFNNDTGRYEQILDSEFCIEQAAEENDTATTPTGGEELMLEILTFALTRIFWAFVVISTVFIITLMGTVKAGHPSPEAAGVLSLFVMFYFLAIGWLPVALGVLITAIVGLWILHEFRKPVG